MLTAIGIYRLYLISFADRKRYLWRLSRLQCLALPIHGWVAVVNMLCAGLGNAVGAVLL